MRKVLMVLMTLALVAALPTGALAQGQVLGLAMFKTESLHGQAQPLSEQELQAVEGSAWWFIPVGLALSVTLHSCWGSYEEKTTIERRGKDGEYYKEERTRKIEGGFSPGSKGGSSGSKGGSSKNR